MPRTNLEIAIHQTERTVERAAQGLADWKAKFEDDPVYAMEWSDGIYELMWKQRIYGELLEFLRRDDPVAALRDFHKHATDQCLRQVADPCTSTSDASRLSSRAQSSVLAALLREWQFTYGELEAS